ncbi:MAG: MATE family efflux transporter [bacterium]|nr:MATE family efflux transporter [bacterium]
MLKPGRKGQASTLGEFLRTSLPTVIDLSSQTLMWAYEAILIGRLSAEALAGHGLAVQLIVNTFMFLLTFVVGASLIMNRHLGRKDTWKANHIFGQSVFLGFILAIIIGLTWYFGAPWLFKIIKETEEPVSRIYGIQYLQTLSYFTPLIVVNFVCMGILRGVGDTKITMVINLLLNGLNVVLAPLLIFGRFGLPRLEVVGAAIAVGISHSIGLLMTIYMLRSRRASIFLSIKEITTPKWESVKLLFKTGLPTTVEQLSWNFGQLIVSGYAARLGVVVLATHIIILRIQAVMSMLYTGFGLGSMTLVGKNVGADDNHKAEKTGKIALVVVFLIVILMAILTYIHSNLILRLFTNNVDVLNMGEMIMVIFLLVQIPKALNTVLTGNLRGVGDLQWLMWLMILAVGSIQIGTTWVTVFFFHYALAGIWIVHGTDELVRVTLNFLRFRRGKWKNQNGNI